MKTLYIKICTLIFLLPFSMFAQRTEFKDYGNGLMYSDITMSKLKFIVDSMNLKYKVCDLWKDYYSVQQAVAYRVYLDSSAQIKELSKRIDNGISIEAIKDRYPKADVKEVLVIKYLQDDYEGNKVIKFAMQDMSDWGGSAVYKKSMALLQDKLKGKWVSDYNKATKYSSESIVAFYFPDGFESKPLADEYAKMIQYADCMIDTTKTVFFNNVDWEEQFISRKKQRKLKWRDSLDSYLNIDINKYCGKEPNYEDYKDSIEVYYSKSTEWIDKRQKLIDEDLSKRVRYKQLLAQAVDEALKYGYSDSELENYVSGNFPDSVLLVLKRHRQVVGMCSMDQSPRNHAFQIAQLAASSTNWEIFLRAHLDIMNDNFSRASDGSYAWAGRLTYIKELEELDFDVAKLLLGISLRIENPSGKHYFGSIGRLGRAISESKDAGMIEKKLIEMVYDNNLDYYNRQLMYCLYANYVYNLKNETDKGKGKEMLNQMLDKLPSFMTVNAERHK